MFKIGNAIKQARGEKFSQEDAAGEAGISSGRFQRMEAGADNFNKWLADAEKVAKVFGMTLGELIEKGRVK